MLPIKDTLKSSTALANAGNESVREENIDVTTNTLESAGDHFLDAPPLPPVEPYFSHDDEPQLT